MPTDFTDELDLYLYIRKSVKGDFYIADEALVHDSHYELPKDWWSVWRCECIIGNEAGDSHVAMFTNAATYISFICYGYADDFDSLICEFEGAFLSSLKAQGLILPDNVSTHTRLIRGNPRKLVGTMKELKEHALAMAANRKKSVTPAAIED